MMNKNDSFRWDCVKGTRQIKQQLEKAMEGISVVDFLAQRRELRANQSFPFNKLKGVNL